MSGEQNELMEDHHEPATTSNTWEDLRNENRSETFLFDLSDIDSMDDVSVVGSSEDANSTLSEEQSFEDSFDEEDVYETPTVNKTCVLSFKF